MPVQIMSLNSLQILDVPAVFEPFVAFIALGGCGRKITMLYNTHLLAVSAALFSRLSRAEFLNTTTGPGYISYSTVTGYFLQDEPDTVASGFDYVCYIG